MNKLQQAYIDLGLQPGAPLDQVSDRWRIVARMWHPDRAATEQERTIAEAELKKVNGARDLIQRHYQDGLHRLVGCECSADPVEDPRGSMYEGTSHTSPPPRSAAGAGYGNGAAGAQAAGSGGTPKASAPGTGARRRKAAQPQAAPPVVASVITAGMVLLAMSIVKMNSGVRIEKRQSEGYGYESAPVQSWRSQPSGGGGVSQSTIASLRPSPLNQAETATSTAAGEDSDANADRDVEKRKADEAKARAKEAQQQQIPKAVVEFVSADGRLISLADGTTWELWPQEAADSFFAWQPGDKITVKGKQSGMPWLVNDSRNHQAVKVTRVE